MKSRLIVLAVALLAFSCGRSNSDKEADERNSSEHVESTTEENRSPNLQNNSDTGSRLYVDTVSSAGSVEREKKEDSLELDTKE